MSFGNARAKANAHIPAHIQARRAEEPFSLRRGLDSVQFFFKLSITSYLLRFASETTKATLLGRPRIGCYAASGLACAPPIEGWVVAAPVRDEPDRVAQPFRCRLGAG